MLRVIWVGYKATVPLALCRSPGLRVNEALFVPGEHWVCCLFQYEILSPDFRMMLCCACS